MIQHYAPTSSSHSVATSRVTSGHAVITGASSGIGRCIAHLLAERGFTTTLVALEHELLLPLSRQLWMLAPSEAIAADLSDPHEVERVTRHISGLASGVQVLVNCAGYGVYGPLHQRSVAEVAAMMQVNFMAGVSLVHGVLPRMLADGRGHIIQVCSMSAHMGAWGLAGYSASKAAQRAFGESIAAECVGTGVTLSNIHPGIVNTAYFDAPTLAPLWRRVKPRAIDPGRVARAAVATLDRPKLNVFVPWHYRLLSLMSFLNADAAMRVVRGGSLPRGAVEGEERGMGVRDPEDVIAEDACGEETEGNAVAPVTQRE